MGTLPQDLRYGLRMLAKNPGFAAVAVVALALGIGANAAIFSVINAALLRPLPYWQPDRLLTLGESRDPTNEELADTSYPDYLDWVRQTKSFQSLAAYDNDGFILTGSGSPEVVQAARVTSSFFSTLGVKPALGRDFVSGEDRPNGDKMVILSHNFWKDRFGARSGAVGQTIRLDGQAYTIIGVLPPEFEFAPTHSPPVWVPLSPYGGMAQRRNLRWLMVIGRLRQGSTFAQASAEMQTINAGLATAYPQENGKIHISMGTLRERIIGRIRPLLITLFGAVSFVLLIACANVAGLLLARGAQRKREIALRMALGAGRAQLLRQFLTESVLLALAGGGLGLLWSQWFVSLMVAAIPKERLAAMPYLNSVTVDPRVLAFTLVVALATGILFGLAPAFEASRADVSQNLKEQVRGSAGHGTSRLRSIFVVAEIGLALMLLAGAGLMLRSMSALFRADPGFETRNLLTFAVYLPPDSYKDDASHLRFYQSFSDRLRSLPGVQGVATVSVLPLTGGGNTIRFVVEGRPTAVGAEDECNIRDISAGYFSLMKIPLREGRFFRAGEKATAPPTVIVNQAFAKRYFPGDDPLGKRIRFTFAPTNPFQEILGVVGNENIDQLDTPMPPIIYTSFDRGPDSYTNYVVRASGSAGDMLGPVRAALHDQDAELPLIEPQTMDQIIAASPAVFLRRYPSYLLGSFAVLAITLAMVGLYGLISFSVAQRTQEIGIRMALGAEPSDVLKMVVKQGVVLTGGGLAAGVAGALALTRFLAGFLYGVKPTDPVAFVEVSAILAAVALLACYIPARRATKVDPLVALRYE
jgi:putative ABC transport system permease protein